MLDWVAPSAKDVAAAEDVAFWHSVLSFVAGWSVCMVGCVAMASAVAHAGTTSLLIRRQRVEVLELEHLAGSATSEWVADFMMGIDALVSRQLNPSALANMARRRIAVRFTSNLGRVITLPTGMLHRLRVLDMQHNSLAELPSSIKLMTGLERLNVSDNLLTSLPDELGLLTSLRTVNCRDNMLETLPSSIGNLKSLNALLLDRNKLTKLPKEIAALWSLRVLRLSGNALASTIEANLHTLPSLYLLTLDNNLLALPSLLTPPSSTLRPEHGGGVRSNNGNENAEHGGGGGGGGGGDDASDVSSNIPPFGNNNFSDRASFKEPGDASGYAATSLLLPPGTPEKIPTLRRLTVGPELLPALHGRCARLEQLTIQLPPSPPVVRRVAVGSMGRVARPPVLQRRSTAARTPIEVMGGGDVAVSAAAAGSGSIGLDGSCNGVADASADDDDGLKGLEQIGTLAGLSLLPANDGGVLLTPPPSVLRLTQLTMLRLAGLNLKHLPESIQALASLTLLAIENNQLVELPHTLGNMKSLKTLRVHRNPLMALPLSLGKLANTLNSLTVDQSTCKRLLAAHATTKSSLRESRLASAVLSALNTRLLSATWTIKRHQQATFGRRTGPLLFSTLVSARHAVNKGTLPGLPVEMWLAIFEKLPGEAFAPWR